MTTDFNVALQNQLSERQRRKDAKGGVERIYSRRQIEQAFLETFEMVGGVPRLAIWANNPENYSKFLELMMKLAPKDTGGAIAGAILEYRSNVPQSPLNKTKVSVDEDVTDVPEENGDDIPHDN